MLKGATVKTQGEPGTVLETGRPRTLDLARSAALYELARHVSPGGVQNAARVDEPHPLYIARAAGSRLWDVDDNEYLDFHAGHGPALLGYNHPEVLDAAVKSLTERGPHFGLGHPGEVHLSRQMATLIPGAEMVGLCGGGGSDPCYHAIRLSRTFTGRRKIIRFEGSTHGWAEPLSVSDSPHPDEVGPYDTPHPVAPPGALSEVIGNTIVLPHNDPAVLERRLARDGHEVAALIVEPVVQNLGCVPLVEGFPRLLRQVCDHYGIVLIYDEIQTGFRHDLGGMQKLHGVTADLATFGKAMANGFILSAITGKRRIMSLFQPEGDVRFSGTFNGHVLGVDAALKTIEILQRGDRAVHHKLFHLGRLAADGLSAAITQLGVKARVQAFGSVFALYFTDQPVRNYRDLMPLRFGKPAALREAYRKHAMAHGIYIPRTPGGRCFISAAHTEDDIARVVDVTTRFLTEHREDLR
jgi:glutamate-1-semialdehyde 2,1-aminomutase